MDYVFKFDVHYNVYSVGRSQLGILNIQQFSSSYDTVNVRVIVRQTGRLEFRSRRLNYFERSFSSFE